MKSEKIHKKRAAGRDEAKNLIAGWILGGTFSGLGASQEIRLPDDLGPHFVCGITHTPI
jgi:hypothetical protein